MNKRHLSFSVKAVIIIILAIVLRLTVHAQQSTFQKTIGGASTDYAYDAHRTLDGGYIFGGVSMSYPVAGQVCSYVVRTNANGDTLWTAAFGGTGGACDGQYVNDITQTSDSGFLAVGGKGICGDPNSGGNMVRLDKNGNVVWAKYNDAYADPYPVIQSNDGNFIVGGYIMGVGAGLKDAPLIKLDANGDTIWARNYGGTGDDWFYHILQTPDNGYIAAGKTTSFGQGGNDIYIVRTNSIGNLRWAKAYGTSMEEIAFGHSIEPTTDGGYIVGGQGDVTQSPKGMFLMKIDSLGNMSWAKYYTGMDGHGVKQTADGGYILTGRSSTGVQLVKTDASGNISWSKVYTGGTAEKGLVVVLASDGGYMVGGQGNFSGNTELYMIKTDANGNSGCNEANAGVTATVAPFVTVNTATLVSVGSKTSSYPYLFQRGGFANSLCSTVGFDDVVANKNSSLVYPDPFTDHALIKLSEEIKDAELKVYDVLGNEVMNMKNINSSEIKIERGQLKAGIYFYKLNSENINGASGKFIIE